MKKDNYLKAILPHIIAVAVFIVVGMIYMQPILQGLELRQSDMIQAEGTMKELVDYRDKTGDGASWANTAFSGMPSYQIVGPNTPNVLTQLSMPLKLWGWQLDIGILFMYMIGFYVFVIAMKGSPWLGIVAGLAYALASYNIIIVEVGHITKAWAMSMIAPIFAGMILAFRKKLMVGVPLFVLALAFQLYFNHIQITYYTMIAGVVMGITYLVYAIREKQIKDFLIAGVCLFIGAFIALIPNSTNIALNNEYVAHTMRGGKEITVTPNNQPIEEQSNNKGLDIDYAFAWSYGVGETLSILIPDARGGGSSDQRYEENAENRLSVARSVQPQQAQHPQVNQVLNQYVQDTYWGNQPFTAGTVYFGAIVVFLAFLSMFLIKGQEKWWLLIATIISIVLSWGSNFMSFNEFLFNYLPMYNKFRVPAMALVLTNVTVLIMAVLCLKEFFNSEIDSKKKTKALYISTGVVAGLCLLCAIIPSLFASFSSAKDANYENFLGTAFMQALYEDRKGLFVSDAFRSFGFIIASAAILFLFANNKIKNANIVLACIGLLIVIDLWQVDNRYLTENNYVSEQEVTPYPSQADQQIFANNQARNINHYRVYNMTVNTFNDASTSYFHPSIGGYHGAKLQRYQDIIDFYMLNQSYYQKDLADTSKLRNNQLRQIFYQYSNQLPKLNFGVMNMLNARYFIMPLGENGSPVAIENTDACGSAWFVPEIRFVEDANQEILALDNFDPKQVAFVDKKFKDIASEPKGFDAGATVKMERNEDNSPDYLKYTTNSKTDGVLVCSEIYYSESWKAYIDGKEVPYFRANYLLRAINVPAGEHVIEFKIENKTLNTWNIVTGIGSALILLTLLVLIGYPIYRNIQAKKIVK